MDEKLKISIKATLFSSKKFICYIVLLLFLLYLFSGTYSVSPNQVGVLQRFGKVIDDRIMPGMHFAFPWPVDKVNKVPIKTIRKLYIKDFSSLYSEDYEFYDYRAITPYCITGDNNIMNMGCNLQYMISDPRKYLFNILGAENILREIACNVIIHNVAALPIDVILTYGKRQLEEHLKNKIQDKLENINCGLTITFVELKDVSPPAHVRSSFNDVINARMDRKKTISKAETYMNVKIPAANTEANKLIEEARAYREEAIAVAEGDSARFIDKLKRYWQAKKVTKTRLYLEFLNDTLSEVDEKYFISVENNTVPATIKLLNIEE